MKSWSIDISQSFWKQKPENIPQRNKIGWKVKPLPWFSSLRLVASLKQKHVYCWPNIKRLNIFLFAPIVCTCTLGLFNFLNEHISGEWVEGNFNVFLCRKSSDKVTLLSLKPCFLGIKILPVYVPHGSLLHWFFTDFQTPDE